MGQFITISSSDLEDTLSKEGRQYLVGNLKLPQMLQHVHSDNIEIGISDYEDNEIENAHFHPEQTEYQLVLWGKTEYLDLDLREIFCFSGGDFYCIKPFTKYAQRIYGKTRILFIKTPAINDKVLIEHDPFTSEWLESHIVNRARSPRGGLPHS